MKHQSKLQFKEGLKAIAKEIKTTKTSYRNAMREKGDWWPNQIKCAQLRTEFRHKHLAYCILRGTPREKVESNPSTGNPVNERLLVEYLTYFQSLIDGDTTEVAQQKSLEASKAYLKVQKNQTAPTMWPMPDTPVTFFVKVSNFFKSLFN